MAQKTKISWTEYNWNCIRGCTRVSAGCDNCYAINVAHRFGEPGMPYEGLSVVRNNGSIDWSGKIMLVEKDLLKPLRWTKPRKIFVTSTSDPFHHNVPDEYLDKMFAVMALTPQHTYQLLTKRPERMRNYLLGANDEVYYDGIVAMPKLVATMRRMFGGCRREDYVWPLPNVWLGVSCEDQKTADERIPILLETPAAVRWISAEPLLGPIDLVHCGKYYLQEGDGNPGYVNSFNSGCWHPQTCIERIPDAGTQDGISWVVVGGESGPRARLFDLQWARNILDQCRTAGVPFFMKQMGSNPSSSLTRMDNMRVSFTGKGDDPSEWPKGLQVQEWPQTT